MTSEDDTEPKDGYEREDWQGYYDQDDLRWDLGEVSPPLKRLWEEGTLKTGRMIIPGCGQGHEVIFFAQQGFDVTGVEYTEGGIKLLQENLGKSNLNAEVVHSDFFELDASHHGRYDLMLEQTFFCAIHPRDRTRYVEMALKVLKPGGLLAGLFYNTGEEDGPPYNTTEEDVRQNFSNGFDIVCLEKCDHSIERRENKELLAVLQKR
ncbi:MAG: methyltransferase domain-containing protein [Candidatus Nitronauta litoralis]|uniref:Methyltransferase domain-containing protein n=1 Tax=Candidatus Nitronauta litoralis TaxID=2705533 RepID=A0A7T0BTF6_9BACT|nr:MAG: methyltransferase domain-containing protein [Candidatus Nitronauta litoralis]